MFAMPECIQGSEKWIADLVQKEVDVELKRLGCLKHGIVVTKCKFCPYRTFDRSSRCRDHISKHHCKNRLFAASSRNQCQWTLVTSIFNQDEMLGTLRPPVHTTNLLETSAQLLRSWNVVDETTAAFLRGQNEFDVVLCICADGPLYRLCSQTQGLNRLNAKTFYDNEVANIVFALLLRHRGKSKAVFMDLLHHWVTRDSESALLSGCILRDVRTQSDLIDAVLQDGRVQELRAELLDTATARGEFEILSHDVTYKVLLSIVGQEAMAQVPGESHGLHTFIGKTGMMPGGSLQHTEDGPCFKAAATEVLTNAARATTKVLFSDSPSTLEGNTDEILPNLLGIVEDGLHLVIRMEACFGEHRVAVTREALALQSKFKVPTTSRSVYHGRGFCHGPEGTWSPNGVRSTPRPANLENYCGKPYTSHQQYMDDLMDLTVKYPEEMSRKNKKSRTLSQVIESGAAYHHYAYLHNGSVLLNNFSESEREHMNTWTVGNEALHNQIKTALRTVTLQHEDSLKTKVQLFAMDNMLAHSSAAYHPTSVQYSQQLILAVVQGRVRSTFFPKSVIEGVVVNSKRDARRSPVELNSQAARVRAAKFQKRADKWAAEISMRERRPKHESTHTRRIKRTVFTMKRGEKLKRLKKRPAARTEKLKRLKKRPAVRTPKLKRLKKRPASRTMSE